MLKADLEQPFTEFFRTSIWTARGDRWFEVWLKQWADDFERLAPGRTEDDLRRNPDFRSTSIRIARIVLGERQPRKLFYLRNALLKVAIGKGVPSDLKLQIFLNAIESLSLEHIEVLSVSRHPDKRPLDENRFVMGLGQGCHDSLVQAVLNELRSRGLLEDVGPDEVFPKGIPYAITNLGIEFLNFILKPFPQ